MEIATLFADKALVSRIQERLPELFYIAELESSRAGKVGMEVGSARERIVIALLIYKFGQENIDTDIPITQPEVDVRLHLHHSPKQVRIHAELRSPQRLSSYWLSTHKVR